MATGESLPFAGRAAFITGAAGGIGAATAIALAEAGADLALNDLRPPDATAEAVRSRGRRALTLPGDVSDAAGVEATVARAANELGRLDLFVSCAVYSDREPFTTANLDGFRRTIDVSLMGSYYALRAWANAAIARQQGGAAVVVSSPHAVVPFPNCMAYNMAKAAQDIMARTAALELVPHRIRVNIVHPGWTDTPGERKFFSEEKLAVGGAGLPAGRLGRGDEVARGILFLLHPDAEYINGTTLTIDGGVQLPWWSKRETGAI